MLSDQEEENIVWTYFAVQNSTTEGAYFAIPILTFSAMKHPKVRGVVIYPTTRRRDKYS